MTKQTPLTNEETNASEAEVRALYHELLRQWNEQNAKGMAALFTENGNVVGFDGSQMNGRTEIRDQTSQIFKDHRTGKYVGKVRDVRFLGTDVAILGAVSGLVPAGQTDLNPNVNTIHTLVASRDTENDGKWRIEVYQNTPAAFHGRPELSEALTEELRELLRTSSE